jgi:hypothetical protein
MLVNKFKGKNKFIIKRNLINTNSTKYKHIIWNNLAFEICGIVNNLDLAYIITVILKIIIDQRNLPEILIVFYIDSKFLYECIMKLRITKEKYLIINMIAIRQTYEKKKLFEIRYINKQDNPTNTITKLLLNKILKKFINMNELTILLRMHT